MDAEQYCQSEYNGHLVSVLDFSQDKFLEIAYSKLKSPLWIGIRTQVMKIIIYFEISVSNIVKNI